MSCQNCFNGCAEIVSDRCVRYTGIDIPSLGITTGDSLSDVEQSLTTFLISVMSGEGIHPIINGTIVCDLVGKYLQSYTSPNIVDFVTVLINSTCDLQEQVTIVTDMVEAIELDYDVDCLDTVTSSSGTHAILQKVITTLCDTNLTLDALKLAFETQYDYNNPALDNYIANYIANHSSTTTLISAKMIPYVAYPYFSTDLSHFNANGEGTGDWAKVYLCNGYAGKTPDMRGRVPVAATDCPGPAITDVFVLPGGYNPSYIVGGALYGSNSITLISTQVPNHTHTASGTVTLLPHNHLVFNTTSAIGTGATPVAPGNFATYRNDAAGEWMYQIKGSDVSPTLGKTSETTVTTNTVTVSVTATTGGGNAHANNQPAIACQFIMYVP